MLGRTNTLLRKFERERERKREERARERERKRGGREMVFSPDI
jgi:hypothetical protein